MHMRIWYIHMYVRKCIYIYIYEYTWSYIHIYNAWWLDAFARIYRHVSTLPKRRLMRHSVNVYLCTCTHIYIEHMTTRCLQILQPLTFWGTPYTRGCSIATCGFPCHTPILLLQPVCMCVCVWEREIERERARERERAKDTHTYTRIFIRDVTHWRVTWLIDTWHDSLTWDMTHCYVTWLIDMSHVNDVNEWHDSLTCDMTHWHVTC